MGNVDIVSRSYSIHEAKAKFSELVKLAEAGEDVEITRHGKTVARMVGASQPLRAGGWAKGTVWVDWDNFEFTEEEIDELFHAPLFSEDEQ